VKRNVAWHTEPLDAELLAAVRTILQPVWKKQWSY
jgi:hypothetical protein